MARKKRLLLLGPSFRRNRSGSILPAFERYDGLFFRVAKKYITDVNDVDVAVMTDDLVLVDGSTPLPYDEPEGKQWGGKTILKSVLEEARAKNESYLERKLRNKKYSEIFISMGKDYAAALPNLSKYDIKVVFPASGGPGPKAQALKQWLSGK